MSGIMMETGVRLLSAAETERAGRVLPPEALELVAQLHREFEAARRRLLNSRAERYAWYGTGAVPDYLPMNELPEAHGAWTVAPLPPDLMKRRVEITGPIHDPKMVINMLSRGEDGSRADAAMLDFEDSMKPSWDNVTRGLENLIGAADGTLSFTRRGTTSAPARRYGLDPDDMALLMVRVRGLHLEEVNVEVDGQPVAAGLFDLALSAYHAARPLMAQGKTPKFYVPKCENYLEARWWNRVFTRIEESLDLPIGTLRVTFLIETLTAAFQMEEILYEIRDRAAGLNVGRWDKIFSDIKVLMQHRDRVLADRGSISMNRPWMKHYALRLIDVCHRHGAFAMGGMAAFTPGRTPERRAEQTRKVVEDKQFEAGIGHDGCWVSHPYFISPAMEPFTRDHQLDVIPDIGFRPRLLPEGTGPLTLDGLRKNVRVGIAYLRGWHADTGCVAWDDLMEDLATLEISRAQVWQWTRHGVRLDNGTQVTRALVERIFDEELRRILGEVPAAEHAAYAEAAQDARAIFLEPTFRPFLTCRSEPAGQDLDIRRAALRDGSLCVHLDEPETAPCGS